ncbi:secreted trypsin-like serine protease [Beggiatoa alba B18LD]|uniref:Secreted trypsin-like serine protease n=1 Tax=Beggiatoa alba B18LD TaxID=395493 RepID=I3CEQ7_9GAMM|nr:serine protease [Beggiatoa alba]EIJ42100.1 secreted trypsin-like serine protease [Beggiatoa alba B18LD]
MRYFLNFLCLLIGISPLIASDAQVRVIGGSTAAMGQYPWMVLITYKNDKLFSCGGTLIASDWVLTAAHCTHDENTKISYKASDLTVAIAENNLTVTAIAQVQRPIRQIILSPQYNFDSLFPQADFALLQLQTPMTTVTPVHLVDAYTLLDEVGMVATVVGWGQPTQNSYPSYSEVLKQANVPIISTDICNEPRSYNGYIKDFMLCAGYAQGGIDACVGDSGGGLVINTATGWQQLGIVSFGNGCAQPNYYGIYTRIASYLSFIQSQICTTFPESPKLIVSYADGIATAIWDTVAGADGYNLYFAPYSYPMDNRTLEHIASVDLGQQPFFQASLQPNERYYVAVTAYRGNCSSPFSNIESTKNF